MYKEEFWRLANNHGYILNSLNVKIDNPEDDNHSDNELNFLAYHTLFYSLQRLGVKDTSGIRGDVRDMVGALVPSMDRHWQLVKGELSPLWLGIYAGTAGQAVDKSDVYAAVWSLRHWSLDLINWPIDNTLRWDVTAEPFHKRDSDSSLMKEIRPPMERMSSHWNSDPFELQTGSGLVEYEPAVWMLPYYLMRYNGLISA
jgi:hypothetical protein